MFVKPGKFVAVAVGAAILLNSTGAVAAAKPRPISPSPWLALSTLESTSAGAMSTVSAAQFYGENPKQATNLPPLPVVAVLLATLLTAAIVWLEDDNGKIKLRVRPVSPD